VHFRQGSPFENNQADFGGGAGDLRGGKIADDSDLKSYKYEVVVPGVGTLDPYLDVGA
jgi:hypothetical protein